MLVKILLLQIVLLCSVQANAAVDLKSQLGLGHTDNVYQDDLNKKSDWFTWLQLESKSTWNDGSLSAKANLNIYTRESANNFISYSVRHITQTTLIDNAEQTLGLGGFTYFKSDIGSTDQAYNHFYATGFFTKNWLAKSYFDMFIEPGFKLSSYPQLGGRYDLSLFGRVDSYWRLGSTTELNPYFELAFVFSNKSYYEKNEVSLGFMVNEKLQDDLKLSFDVFLKSSSYPGRKVADILIVPDRRGRATTVNVDVNENISLFQLSAYATKIAAQDEFTTGFNYASQNSLSELQYYKELQILMWWQRNF